MTEGTYTYDHLDKNTIEKAKKELRENTTHVRAHIESFRRWVKSMPHLQCPTDDEFLLRFLRHAKFDHSKAEKRLDNFCTVRSSTLLGVPTWFALPAIDDPIVDQYFAMKFQIPLGYTENGMLVLLVRPHNWDHNLFPIERAAPLIYMGIDILVSDEHTVINGITILLDLGGIGGKILDIFGNQKNMKTYFRNLQEVFPMRIKNIIFFKEPLIFDVVFKMMQFWMKDKMKKRMLRVKDNITKIYDRVPGIKKILPTEYGGEAGTVDECIGRWRQRNIEYYSKSYPLKDISVDESKRPKTTLSFLANYADYPDDVFGKQGTYTKLNV